MEVITVMMKNILEELKEIRRENREYKEELVEVKRKNQEIKTELKFLNGNGRIKFSSKAINSKGEGNPEMIRDRAKDEKEREKKVHIGYQKLIVHGETLTWDQKENILKPKVVGCLVVKQSTSKNANETWTDEHRNDQAK
ncbi:hypothetical protein HHI36_018550 [Cryptolaemus montrouzieri]|uniref:Uncharacterized protein n=1 Tax=Cryptolaemus montrouzieri TaxID=559131 RepID=A0ABD2P0F2_9CUCU